MVALIVLGCVVLVIILFLLLRVGCRVDYSDEGLILDLKIACFHIRLMPKKDKVKKPKKQKKDKAKKKKKKKKKKKGSGEEEEQPKKKGNLSWLLELVSPALTALGRLRKKLRVKLLRVEYAVPGASDPAAAAMRYGVISAGGGALFPLLNAALDVENWDLNIYVDFLAEKTKVALTAEADYRVGTLLHIVFALGFRALAAYMNSRKQSEHEEDKHHGRETSDR